MARKYPISGVYQIQSKVKPKRIYVGSSKDVYARWTDHLLYLRKGEHHSKKLQFHYNKYGEDDLVFSIIVCCDRDDLYKVEQFYIDAIGPWFNILSKAVSIPPRLNTASSTEKFRAATVGKKHSVERRMKQSINSMGKKNGFYGKKHTEEANEKRRQFMLANPRTREAREKQSASLIKYHERRKMEKELETQMNYSHAV